MLERRHVAQEPEGLLRRPADWVKDLAGVDHLPEPSAAFSGTLHGQEQGEQARSVGGARVLAKGLAQGKVLGLTVRREPTGVGRQEGEGRLLVAAVFGEVEVDAPDETPGRAEAPEEVLEAELGRALLVGEGHFELSPERRQDRGCEVLGPGHHRSSGCERLELVGSGLRRRDELLGSIDCLAGAERGHESGAELPPVAEDRWQDSPDLRGAEEKEPVAGAPREGLLDALGAVRLEYRSVVGGDRSESAARGQAQGAGVLAQVFPPSRAAWAAGHQGGMKTPYRDWSLLAAVDVGAAASRARSRSSSFSWVGVAVLPFRSRPIAERLGPRFLRSY